MFPSSNWFLGGVSRPRIVAPIQPPISPDALRNPSAPPGVVPSVALPIATVTTLPVAIAASAPSVPKAAASAAIVTGTIFDSQRIVQEVRAAVARVPTFQEQTKAVAAAITTTPTQRAEVARIVAKAKTTLAEFQPARTTEDGIVVESKSPTPTVRSGAILSEENAIVPKLLAEPHLSGGPGVASNEAGPPTFLILAAALAILFFLKV